MTVIGVDRWLRAWAGAGLEAKAKTMVGGGEVLLTSLLKAGAGVCAGFTCASSTPANKA